MQTIRTRKLMIASTVVAILMVAARAAHSQTPPVQRFTLCLQGGSGDSGDTANTWLLNATVLNGGNVILVTGIRTRNILDNYRLYTGSATVFANGTFMIAMTGVPYQSPGSNEAGETITLSTAPPYTAWGYTSHQFGSADGSPNLIHHGSATVVACPSS